jgi:hypothetical protein
MSQILVTIPEDPAAPITATRVDAALIPLPAVVTDWRTETGFPKMKQVDGNQYLLFEPINPDWKSGPSNRVFGGSGPSGPFLSEPSNSDATHPRRSPAGYPLFYGKISATEVADPVRWPPRVMYDDQTFANDAEVADYKVRTGVTT